jgi:hypothetical protein
MTMAISYNWLFQWDYTIHKMLQLWQGGATPVLGWLNTHSNYIDIPQTLLIGVMLYHKP